ncbi:growth arrest-specific protein 1b [Cyprinodon tularosa]|uniref:growth arrest-specific protein 1b n=1 Tax=Cyprinodon tularosa TaxID=77115 RepID=UPI0018E20608|nr:growth arrest-specific protein 1b [Cyprinodon tularosa]
MERVLLLICCELIIAIGFSGGSPNHKHRPACWKAILKCHGEPDCRYAYDQYIHACAPVISGVRKICPSHCISSLIQLNLTQNGPDLEDCDCAMDLVCRSTQQAIDPCVPRTRAMGCTEARLQCETDPACSSAMRDYLFQCRKLFGGQRCSEGCRKVIANMRSIPKALQLDACVCDGSDRNICEYIKLSMRTLCSESSDGGSGFSDTMEDTDDDDIYQDDYYYVDSSGSSQPAHLKIIILVVIFMGFIQ